MIPFVPKMISKLGYKIYLTAITLWSWWWEVGNEQDKLARTILTISVPTLVLLWYKWVISSYATTSSLPPGPYGLPIVGYLPFLGSNLHERFTEMANRYGPIFSLKLGSKLHVVVNSMDLVKKVSRDLDHTLAYRNPPLTALAITYGGLDIAWSNNTVYWRNLRKLLASQVLSNANLKASQTFRTREVRKTVNQVYAKIGEKIDINEIAFNTEVNVVTSMLWGISKSGEGKDSIIGDGFREVEFKIIELIGAPNISDFLPMLSWLDLQGRQRDMQRQFEYVNQIFDKIIEERINLINSSKNEQTFEEDGKKDFVQILLELKDQKDAPTSLSITQIKALLMVLKANPTEFSN